MEGWPPPLFSSSSAPAPERTQEQRAEGKLNWVTLLVSSFGVKPFGKEGWNIAKIHCKNMYVLCVSKNHGVKLRAQRDHCLPSDRPTLSPWTPTGMVLETGPYQRESLIYHWLLGLWFLAKICKDFWMVKWTLYFIFPLLVILSFHLFSMVFLFSPTYLFIQQIFIERLLFSKPRFGH